MPYILGLTGNIASGKTTVGLMLLELGLTTYVDADTVVHELYLPGQALPAELARAFGPGVLDSAGGVDRRALGAIVFNSPERMAQLESIVHPRVREALLARLRALGPDEIGALDAVKLIESGYAPFCHGTLDCHLPPRRFSSSASPSSVASVKRKPAPVSPPSLPSKRSCRWRPPSFTTTARSKTCASK